MPQRLETGEAAADGLYRIEGGTFTFTARDTGGIPAEPGYSTDKRVTWSFKYVWPDFRYKSPSISPQLVRRQR